MHTLFTRTFWQYTLGSISFYRSLFSILGVWWLFLELNTYFELIAIHPKGYGIVFFTAAFIFALWWKRPAKKVCYKLPNLDVKIEIRIGDILKLQNCQTVISTNSTFDTDMSGNLISPNSLQGKFTKAYYTSVAHLNGDIDRSLAGITSQTVAKTVGKTEKYEIGTVAKLSTQGRFFYLVAMSDINNDGVAQSNLKYIEKSLASLWHFIANKGELEDIAIPLVGTGHGRITETREEVIKLIVRSFERAIKSKVFTKKLIIVIHAPDYRENHLNLYELGDFLRLAHKYEPSS
jgi:hypothetical protein